jgi:hypothetical protein
MCLTEKEELTRMTAQVNELIWKPGRTGNIDFCGNFKRLQEKEPKTAALLLGHFEEGYSVGRRKKPVPDTSMKETSQNGEIIVHGTNEQVLVRIAIALEGINKTLKSMRGNM